MADKSKSKAYVREWMQMAGLKQADLVKKLDWSKAKANAVWHGDQRANEDLLEEVASLVSAKTYELLLPPEEAMRLRRLSAVLLDAVRPVETPPAPPPAQAVPARRKVS